MDHWSSYADDYELTQAALLEAGITDGLPVIPPTADRVDRMLAAAGRDPQATLGLLPPSYVDITWREVAINAVMAGCTPAGLPIVGAAIAAMCDPAFNLLGIATTTGSACPLVVVNGPAAEAAGMNSGANALGPGNRANASIGRAVGLALRNVGGAMPGEVDMATLGQPGKYTFCLAENEAASPWSPLHVERGFDREQGVVTVVGVSGILEIVDSSSMAPADLARTLAASMSCAGDGTEPVLLLPPEHAELFRRGGCDKQQVRALIHRHAGEPAGWRAEDLLLVVCGGVGRKAAFIPSWSGGTRAISRAIA